MMNLYRPYLKQIGCVCLLYIVGTLFSCQNDSIKDIQQQEIAEIMKGKTNHKGQENKPYLTAGDKTYIVGSQNGNFPDLGSHIRGEMGGVWNHLIKLLDGYWVKISNKEGEEKWLEKAIKYTSYPFGSEFQYEPFFNGLKVTQFQFCPQGKNGVIVRYQIENKTDIQQEIKFEFVAKTDLLPVWSSSAIGLKDANDTIMWNEKDEIFHAKDIQNNWYTVWGSKQRSTGIQLNTPTYINTQGLGKSASSTYAIDLDKGEKKEISFVITGSKNNLEEAISEYQDITANQDRLLETKKTHYKNVLSRGYIQIPDKKFQEVYNWCKIDTEWLVADLDNIGRFQGAGAIEYPWLFGCDNSYTLPGVIATGNQKLAKETLKVIKERSEKANGNGRILHEMAFNGFVSNKGNTQETAHFIIAVWNTFKWSGDNNFLREMYPYMLKGMDFLLKEMDINKNMFPEGYGIMEVKGLNAELIDVSVYTQQALEAMSEISLIMNKIDQSKIYAAQAKILKEKINTQFWDNEEGSFCDFFGSKEQALQTTQGAIDQVKISGKIKGELRKDHIALYEKMYDHFKQFPNKTQKGWLTNKNWVISTPIEMHIVPEDKAIQQLDKVRNENCGEYGPYLSAVERDRMMTISTGVQAMAEATYGRVDEALWYINRIIRTFGLSLPGSINEMMPNYGCPAQAWTIYGLATPLIRYIYGIQPEAHKKVITFKPNLPSQWDHIEIHELPIGKNLISYQVQRTKEGIEISLNTTEGGWEYQVSPVKLAVKKFTVNGVEQQL